MSKILPEKILQQWEAFAASCDWEQAKEMDLLAGMKILKSVHDKVESADVSMFSELFTESQAKSLLGRRLIALNFWVGGEFSAVDAMKFYMGARH